MKNRFEAVYPQPIAFSYGRVLRAGSEIERLDQILHCAEVITRYTAVACIASFAARGVCETAGCVLSAGGAVWDPISGIEASLDAETVGERFAEGDDIAEFAVGTGAEGMY